jgi:hypothetical protein
LVLLGQEKSGFIKESVLEELTPIERACIVECDRQDERFRNCRKLARINTHWIDRETDPREVAALRKVIDADWQPDDDLRYLPIAWLFCEWVEANQEADAWPEQWKKTVNETWEASAAVASAIQTEVVRRCQNMPEYMSDFQRHPRTTEPLTNNVDNVRFFIRSTGARLRFNAWVERIEIKTESPTTGQPTWNDWTPVDDTIVAALRTHASRTGCDFHPTKEFLWDSLLSIAHENTVDPAVEFVAKCEANWDRQSRLDTWLLYAAQCPDDEYHGEVSRNIIGGMVRRIREPGCKHDTVALLIGPQGTGKSALAATLAVNPTWFDDSTKLGDASKELVLALAGKVVVEISEMSGSARDVAEIKAMLSRATDRGRTAYARSVSERPRRNIFIATTNNENALVDDTGNRRFLPVKIDSEVDLRWVRANIEQLIGEAAWLHSRGDRFDIPRSIWATAAEHQEAARQQRTHEVYFSEWFASSDLNVFITAADLATCVKSVEPYARTFTKTLRAMGFVSGDKRVDGKVAKVWYRGRLDDATRYVPRFAAGVMVPSLFRPIDIPVPGQTSLPQQIAGTAATPPPPPA